MSRNSSARGIAAAAIAIAIAIALAVGFWFGRSYQPASPTAPQVSAAPERTVIYYKDPAGKADYSPTPKKDAEGRDYLPVYADEEAASTPEPPSPPPRQGRGKILYYRNPMGLPDTSPVPKKDSMGMDYVPVYEGDDDAGPVVKISVDRVQKLGVRTESAAMRTLTHTIRAVGTVQVDERRLQFVAPKFEGYVEKLFVNTTGEEVHKGETLMEVYSPDLVLAQEEYLAAAKGLQTLDPDATAEARNAARLLADGALLRLRNWDIPRAEVDKLLRSGKASHSLALASPVNGAVLEKNVISGQRFMPGDVLYRIADLSNLWLIAEVYEQELPFVRIGQDARAIFSALPGQSFSGKVTFIYPTLSPETRTAKLRIELPNADGRLKPALYGSVAITTAAGEGKALAIPESALLDSGSRKVVLVERGEGRYEPRDVETGIRADGYVAILKGLSDGEKVVVSANFLIDSESNLRAALQGFDHK